MTPDDFNELIDDCIDHLSDDNPEYGAGTLADLARIFAKAGMPKQSFLNTRQYIINSAIERLGTQATSFIHMKLKYAEQDLQKERIHSGNPNPGTIIVH